MATLWRGARRRIDNSASDERYLPCAQDRGRALSSKVGLVETLGVLALALVALIAVRLFARMGSPTRALESSRFVEITNQADLDALFQASIETPQVLFLYDPYCPISGAATRSIAKLDRAISGVDVSTRHALSREIEARTGIRHESPQVIVVADSAATWHASHGDIDHRTVAGALAAVSWSDRHGSTASRGEHP